MRSVGAVVAGLVVFSLLLYAMGAAGMASLINQSTLTRTLWLLWEALSMIAAGYVTARIAPRAKTRHAVIMGAIQTAFTLLAMFTVRSGEPLWFWLVGIASMMPAAWLGATRATGYARSSPVRSRS